MSRFKGLADAKNRTAEAAGPATPTQAGAEPPPSPAVQAARPKKGPGKRSDPDFVQVTAYIKDDLNRKVKAAMIQTRRDRDFSGLVSELLEGWLAELPRTQQPGDSGTRHAR